MEEWCKCCGKFLNVKDGAKRLNPKRKFCNIICRTRYNSKMEYYRKKDNPEYMKKEKEEYKRWYKKNKERHNKNVLKNYHKNKNKAKWRERNYVNSNREAILKILPKKCAQCGKEGIKEIHHTTYNFPERNPTLTKEGKEKYLQWYCKFLTPFCSKSCHEAYE